jgi:hypothetical protein
MEEHIALVQELASVDRETAIKALLQTKGDAVAAVDNLLVKPTLPGDKYIPAKPVVDAGLSEEQKALCERGRWLQDKVNVVFSVAHSKIRTQPDQGSSEHESPQQSDCPESTSQQTVELEQLQDALPQTTPEVSQS